MATRMELVRHLPNDRASARIGFTITDSEAQDAVTRLEDVEKKKKDGEAYPHFFKFRDAKDHLHFYPVDLLLYVTFISNYEQPVTADEKKDGEPTA